MTTTFRVFILYRLLTQSPALFIYLVYPVGLLTSVFFQALAGQSCFKGKWQDFNSRLTSPLTVSFGEMQLSFSSLANRLYSYESSGQKQDKAKIRAIIEVLKSRREAQEPRNWA
jgi:hypothetical protein